MPEDDIANEAAEPDKDPVPGLGDPPGEDDGDDADGYVCMPADLVKE
jgi:hypothetical protein